MPQGPAASDNSCSAPHRAPACRNVLAGRVPRCLTHAPLVNSLQTLCLLPASTSRRTISGISPTGPKDRPSPAHWESADLLAEEDTRHIRQQRTVVPYHTVGVEVAAAVAIPRGEPCENGNTSSRSLSDRGPGVFKHRHQLRLAGPTPAIRTEPDTYRVVRRRRSAQWRSVPSQSRASRGCRPVVRCPSAGVLTAPLFGSRRTGRRRH